MPRNRKALILFAKAPRAGGVKTRLQPFLTPEQTVRLYRAFINDTLALTSALKGIVRRIACDSGPSATRRDPFFSRLARRHRIGLMDQDGADLGARMRRAFEQALAEGMDPVVIIGTDSPTLPALHIRMAFETLRKVPAVLGPSTDGGYYLIGCSGGVPPVFENVDWGGGKVLAQTVERLNRHRIPHQMLPVWYDVDTLADLLFLSEHLSYLKERRSGAIAKETARVLKGLKLRHQKPLGEF